MISHQFISFVSNSKGNFDTYCHATMLVKSFSYVGASGNIGSQLKQAVPQVN